MITAITHPLRQRQGDLLNPTGSDPLNIAASTGVSALFFNALFIQ